jgi:hypothetical protein
MRKLIVGLVFAVYLAAMGNVCVNHGTRPFPFELLRPVGQPHLNTIYEGANHEKFGLAYKVSLFSEGAWVGYLDERRFVPMIPGKEQDFFKGFGLNKSPEVPETPFDWNLYRWITYFVSVFSLAVRFGLFAMLDLIDWQRTPRKGDEDEEEVAKPVATKIREATATGAPMFGRRRS